MFSGVQSPEGFTKAKSSASKLVLRAAGLSSLPSRPLSLLGGLRVLAAWQLASRRVSNPRESKIKAPVPLLIHEVTHCHFCYILSDRSDSLTPACSQRELIGSTFWRGLTKTQWTYFKTTKGTLSSVPSFLLHFHSRPNSSAYPCILKIFLHYYICKQNVHINILGTSLAVQWLTLHLPMQGVQGGSLVGELRSHMPWSAAKIFLF